MPVALLNYAKQPHPGLSLFLYAIYSAGPLAVLLAWAGDAVTRAPRRTACMLLTFTAATALAALVIGTSGFEDSLLICVAVGAVYGFTVSCLWSPCSSVRDLLRALLRWRLPGTVYAFALLELPLLTIVVVAVSHLLPARAGGVPAVGLPRAEIIRLAAKTFVYELVLLVPWIVGWYGFAARRLLAHHSPLVAALLLGALLAVASWLPRVSPLAVRAPGVLGDLSTAVIFVWLYLQARGSLLPLLLMAAASVAGAFAVFWTGQGFGPAAVQTIVALAQCLLAACLVVGSRMWRGPDDQFIDSRGGSIQVVSPAPSSRVPDFK